MRYARITAGALLGLIVQAGLPVREAGADPIRGDSGGVVWSDPLTVPTGDPRPIDVELPANNTPGIPAGASQYVGTQPTRILDTRRNLGAPGPVPVNGIVTLPIIGQGGVPTGATAVVLNVTATGTAGDGYVTVFPSGQALPNASSLNVERRDQTMPNLVTVPVGADGAVALYASVGMHLIADVQGYYRPVTTGVKAGRFEATEPLRIVDTRQPGSSVARFTAGADVEVAVPGLPAGADSAVFKVTVVDAAGPGYWTLYPAATPRPEASNVNTEFGGQVIASQAIVRLTNGRVRVFAETGGHLLIDLVGYYTGANSPLATNGLFVPVSPGRLLDTRQGFARPGNRRTVEVPVADRFGVPASGVAAVVTNVTITGANPGYLSVWAARRYRPNASSLNATFPGQTIAGHVVTPVSAGGFAAFTDAGTHLIADISGWFTGAPVGAQLPPHLPVPPAGGPQTAQAYNYSVIQLPGGGWESGRDRLPGDVPVTWDVCRPIRYAVNIGLYPQYAADIEEAVDRLASATGLTFTPVGTTDFMPTDAVPSPFTSSQRTTRSGSWDILIALGNEQVSDLVDGSTVGLTGVQWVRSGSRYDFVHAPLVIDVPDVQASPAWGGEGIGQVLLHELAHAVGLDHVFDESQIMNPYISGVLTFSGGDLRGLWDLGVAARPC